MHRVLDDTLTGAPITEPLLNQFDGNGIDARQVLDEYATVGWNGASINCIGNPHSDGDRRRNAAVVSISSLVTYNVHECRGAGCKLVDNSHGTWR